MLTPVTANLDLPKTPAVFSCYSNTPATPICTYQSYQQTLANTATSQTTIIMQKILVTLSLLASAAVGVLAADELKIDVTLPVECERKTQNGDKVSMHYKGTLEANGNKFDASYDRGTPFSFKIGSGQVIKGWDEGLLDMCIGEKRFVANAFPPCFVHHTSKLMPFTTGLLPSLLPRATASVPWAPSPLGRP